MKNIINRIGNNEILTILWQFELITQKHDNLNVYVRFGKGKDYIDYGINKTVINIGKKVATLLPFIYALTGDDTTSAFLRKPS